MKNILIIPVLFISILCIAQNNNTFNINENVGNLNSFSIAFISDIHLQNERGSKEAFNRVIDTINSMDVDFVLTGGDLVYDVLRGNFNRSDSLFKLYINEIKKFKVPVYNTIGNHDLFGIYTNESDIDKSHPDYKYGMYERYLGKTYYSFNHKGWHFISLNSIEENNGKYIGLIDSEQMEWLKQDLLHIDSDTPIVVSTHIPFISTYKQRYPGKQTITAIPNELWIYNRNEVLSLLNEYNLKIVLQGHMHWIEDINIQNKTRFLSPGAVAGRPSWRRFHDKKNDVYFNEEGFIVINFKTNGTIDWKFIDYGWRAISNE